MVFAAVVKGKVLIGHSFLNIVATSSLKECLLFSQYSEKEDKYEEEIKILSDKLKEVSLAIPKPSLGIIFLGVSNDSISTFLG